MLTCDLFVKDVRVVSAFLQLFERNHKTAPWGGKTGMNININFAFLH